MYSRVSCKANHFAMMLEAIVRDQKIPNPVSAVPFGKISPRTKITVIEQLRKGDHVMEESPLGYWHHFLVEKVRRNFAWVIHKTGDQETGMRSLGASDATIKAEVSREKFFLSRDQVVYRVEYDIDDQTDGDEIVFSADEAIRRARRRLGERNYNALTNNCEHFCRECKTGRTESYQVYDFIWTVARLLLGLFEGIFAGAIFVAVTTTGFVAHTSVFFIAHIIGLLLGLIQDLVWIVVQIITIDRAKFQGHVSPVDAERIKAKRVSQTVLGFVGGVIGAAIGYSYVSVQVWGSVLIAVLFNLLCQVLGLVFGRWVATLL